MGRENYREGKEQFMIQSATSCVKHGEGRVWAWACIDVNGMDSLLFIDDLTTDISIGMNSEVYRDILSAHIQPNAKKKRSDKASQCKRLISLNIL